MPIDAHASTQKLIADIESKDRRFRIASSLFLTLIALAVIASGIFLYSSILQSNKHTDQTINKQTNYIRCIARVFAASSLGTVTINDLDQCKLTTNAKPAPQPNAISIIQPSRSTNPLAVSNPAPAGSITQPAPASSKPAPVDNPASAPNPPVKVLGIPVCVPLTNACVRQ